MCFLVIIHVGFRIVGLDAQYSDFKGKVALEAERCANVIIPETPDPVLTSGGVVLLYQDPQSRYKLTTLVTWVLIVVIIITSKIKRIQEYVFSYCLNNLT